LHSCSSQNTEEAGGEKEMMMEKKVKKNKIKGQGEEAEERWKK
jgi:hypothetical protein